MLSSRTLVLETPNCRENSVMRDSISFFGMVRFWNGKSRYLSSPSKIPFRSSSLKTTRPTVVRTLAPPIRTSTGSWTATFPDSNKYKTSSSP